MHAASDSAPVNATLSGAPPLDRLYVAPGGQPDAPRVPPVAPRGPLVVMTWDLLAESLRALEGNLGHFARLSAEDAGWAKRFKMMLAEISLRRPDVLCVQENDHF
eukprot:gene7376-6926_t